jgi:hypothetical protein
MRYNGQNYTDVYSGAIVAPYGVRYANIAAGVETTILDLEGSGLLPVLYIDPWGSSSLSNNTLKLTIDGILEEMLMPSFNSDYFKVIAHNDRSQYYGSEPIVFDRSLVLALDNGDTTDAVRVYYQYFLNP